MFQKQCHRREFLARSSLIALAPTIPAFLRGTLASGPLDPHGRILVVIQLSGGNDGINTIVPFADEGYAKYRRKLRIPRERLIKVSDHAGMHPSLRPAADLLQDGRLAVVQGVGYPNPNRSHDVSMAIWHTARFDPSEHRSFGWLGRAMDDSPPPASGSPHLMLMGDASPPLAIRGRRSTAIALAHLHDLRRTANAARPLDIATESATTPHSTRDLAAFVRRSTLDAYATADLLEQVAPNGGGSTARYPATPLADRLHMIAQLIKADFGTPVYYAVQDGYDTHAAQLATHARLLNELAGALKSFLDDLKAARIDDRVLLLCFSEFGRRVEENASHGTDHGTAGPVLVAGPKVLPGLVGATPSLTAIDDGDLKMNIDFRLVYASILQDWLGLPSEPVLGGAFEPLPLVKRASS